MREMLAGALGLGTAALLSAALTSTASCSCPPGYEPKLIEPGSFTATGPGQDQGHRLVIQDGMVAESFLRNGVSYRIVYRIVGTR